MHFLKKKTLDVYFSFVIFSFVFIALQAFELIYPLNSVFLFTFLFMLEQIFPKTQHIKNLFMHLKIMRLRK